MTSKIYNIDVLLFWILKLSYNGHAKYLTIIFDNDSAVYTKYKTNVLYYLFFLVSIATK